MCHRGRFGWIAHLFAALKERAQPVWERPVDPIKVDDLPVRKPRKTVKKRAGKKK